MKPSPPLQQPDEEGTARQGHDDAHRNLIGRKEHSAQQIASAQQRGTSQSGGDQQRAAFLAHQSAHDMRHNQAHKPYKAAYADRRSGKHRRQAQQSHPQTLRRQAQALGLLLSQEKHIHFVMQTEAGHKAEDRRPEGR